MWYAKKFDNLTLTELYEILRVRSLVFVEEQKITVTDPDDNDKKSIHVFKTENNRVVAYGRVFQDGDHITFGRVLTTPEVRGTGVGNELMTHILKTISNRFPKEDIIISAQEYATGYYQKSGFKPEGKTYLEAGIPHIKMTKKTNK